MDVAILTSWPQTLQQYMWNRLIKITVWFESLSQITSTAESARQVTSPISLSLFLFFLLLERRVGGKVKQLPVFLTFLLGIFFLGTGSSEPIRRLWCSSVERSTGAVWGPGFHRQHRFFSLNKWPLVHTLLPHLWCSSSPVGPMACIRTAIQLCSVSVKRAR